MDVSAKGYLKRGDDRLEARDSYFRPMLLNGGEGGDACNDNGVQGTVWQLQVEKAS